jgi:hypothetical protein
MIEVNVHLVDETSKSILSSTSVKLSPIESKLSLSAIRTGVIGIFKSYASSLSSTGVSKKSVDEWPKLKSSEDFSSIDNAVVQSSAANLQTFQEYMTALKNLDSLMFVQTQGQDVIGLSQYENWYCDDDHTTTEDVAHHILHRSTASPHDSVEEPPRKPSTTATAASTATATATSASYGDTTCITIDLCLAKGFLMPAPTLRVSLRASRSAKDLHGKTFTMYNIFVKQGSLVCYVLLFVILYVCHAW